MTALLVLRPEFHDTFARGVARIAGTIAGAGLATLIVHVYTPGPGALTLLVLVFVWGCYALFRMNYALFTVCLTGYIVFILMLSGVAEMTAATTRALYTIEGGLARARALRGLADLGREHRPGVARRRCSTPMAPTSARLLSALCRSAADRSRPPRADPRRCASRALERRGDRRAHAHGTGQPRGDRRRAPRSACWRRCAVMRSAALALHAGLERGVREPVRGMTELAAQMTEGLATLATSVRTGTPPSPLPPLRQTQLALGATDALVGAETDLMVDSINTIASLLQRSRPTS